MSPEIALIAVREAAPWRIWCPVLRRIPRKTKSVTVGGGRMGKPTDCDALGKRHISVGHLDAKVCLHFLFVLVGFVPLVVVLQCLG